MAVEIIGKSEDVRRYREFLHAQGIMTRKFTDAMQRSGFPITKKPEGYRTFNGGIADVYNIKSQNGVNTIVKKLDPEQRLFIKGIANANMVDRMDERLEPAGINVEHFLKNAVLLLDHLYISSATIGKVTSIDAQADGIYFEAFIGDPSRAELTQQQKDARSLIAQRLLQTVSVGFIPHKVQAPVFDNEGKLQEPAVILNWELLELSVVAIPANAGSVFDVGNLSIPSHGTSVKKTTHLTFNKKSDTIDAELKAADEPTTVQSLIFAKDTFSTKEEAIKWANDHEFRSDKVDETEDSFRLRQKEPSEFEDGSLRTIELTDGVKAVIGRIKKSIEDEKIMDQQMTEMLDEMKRMGSMMGQMSEMLKAVMDKLNADVEADKPADAPKEEPKTEDAPAKAEATEEVKTLRKSVVSMEEKLEKLSAIMLHVLQNQGDKLNG